MGDQAHGSNSLSRVNRNRYSAGSLAFRVFQSPLGSSVRHSLADPPTLCVDLYGLPALSWPCHTHPHVFLASHKSLWHRCHPLYLAFPHHRSSSRLISLEPSRFVTNPTASPPYHGVLRIAAGELAKRTNLRDNRGTSGGNLLQFSFRPKKNRSIRGVDDPHTEGVRRSGSLHLLSSDFETPRRT